jgi:RNA polymerase sigma factor (sigma-70 family)
MTHAPHSFAQPQSNNDLVVQLLARRHQFVHFLQARGHHGSAEDILQAAYLRLVERGVSVRDEQKLTRWFYAVLRNAAIDNVRATKRRRRLDQAAACEQAPEQVTCDKHARLAATLALFDDLEPGYRDLLDSVYVQGLSINDLALRLGITRNAATVRVHRARRALAALVQRAQDESDRRS